MIERSNVNLPDFEHSAKFISHSIALDQYSSNRFYRTSQCEVHNDRSQNRPWKGATGVRYSFVWLLLLDLIQRDHQLIHAVVQWVQCGLNAGVVRQVLCTTNGGKVKDQWEELMERIDGKDRRKGSMERIEESKKKIKGKNQFVCWK